MHIFPYARFKNNYKKMVDLYRQIVYINTRSRVDTERDGTEERI